jgi:hypothetical protein
MSARFILGGACRTGALPSAGQPGVIPMKMLIAVAVAAGVAFCGAAGAKENYREKAFNADSRDKFEAVAADVRRQMESGGRYQYVKPEERTKVDTALAEMSTIFAANESVASMPEETKIKLFNDQEVVNSILTQRDGERVICKKEAPVGSHIPITSCHTYAQEVEARDGTKKQMNEWGRGTCSATSASTGNGTKNLGQQCYMGPGAGR